MEDKERFDLLKDIASCSMCGVILRQCHQLPCFHGLCLEGKEKLPVEVVEGEEGIRCPVCHTFASTADGNTGDMLEQFVDLYIKVFEGNYECAQCSSKDGQWRCMNCKIYLCNRCQAIHRNITVCKDHRIMSHEECAPTTLSVVDSFVSCKEHDAKEIEFYCVTCKTSICQRCFVLNHNTHDCKSLEQTIERVLPHATEQIEKLVVRRDTYRNEIEYCEEQATLMSQVCHDASERIVKQRDEWITKIISHADGETEKIESEKAKRLWSIDMYREVLERSASRMDSLIKWSKNVVGNSAGASLLVELQQGVIMHLNKMCATPSDFRAIDVDMGELISSCLDWNMLGLSDQAKEVTQLEEYKRELSAQNKELENKLDQCEKEGNEWRRKYEKQKMEFDQLHETLVKQFESHQLAETTVENLKSEMRDLEAECNNLREQNGQLRRNLDKQNCELQQVASHMEEKEVELVATQKMLCTEQNNSKELQKRFSKIHSKERSLEEELDNNRASQVNLRDVLQELQTKNAELEEELEKLKEMGGTFREEHRKKEGRLEIKDHLMDELRDKISPELVKDELVTQLIKANEESIERLAAEMSAKVSGNESSLENITYQCRPVNIAREYSLLCSNTWAEAKQALDNADIDEETACLFLCDILMVAREEASTTFANVLFQTGQILKEPLNIEVVGGAEAKKCPGGDLPSGLITQISDYLRARAPVFDVQTLQTNVSRRIAKNIPIGKEIMRYINHSCELAWKMAIQRPPMELKTQGKGKAWEGESVSELFWMSEPYAQSALLRYYITPTLTHGGKTMVKGKVLVR